ncbi:hypothetical protein EXW96_04725 [Paenibacillus sp. JMULE4]|uniref:hypothetical protein n=1 Tax=Paenibacillus TaxID=44249 RepID=UPI0015767019|nr:hypothetical protein [Paenibacillus sp. JMULE4]NTZ16888.1 hypothetical protein [Paenibacillus sp. JMULE4]
MTGQLPDRLGSVPVKISHQQPLYTGQGGFLLIERLGASMAVYGLQIHDKMLERFFGFHLFTSSV